MKIKFLIIRFSSIGDIVLTSPVIRCLKNQVKGAEIHYVTKKRYSSILETNPFIDKLHLFDGNLKRLNSELKRVGFDYIIDLHHNIRSARIKSAVNVVDFSFKKLNFEKYLLVNFKINRLPKKHIVDRYLETCSVFDVKNDGKGLDFFIAKKDNYNLQKLPQTHQSGYVAFVIAGTWGTKKLPKDKVIEICNSIDHPVVLLGGDSETEEALYITGKCRENVVNLTGKINLGSSASLVRDAKVVLTNDTGLMHIAAAFRKKIFSFWGNTIPEFGVEPYLADPCSKIYERKEVKCRPCSKIGFKKCPKNHFKCMQDMDIGIAVKWIEDNFNS